MHSFRTKKRGSHTKFLKNHDFWEAAASDEAKNIETLLCRP